MVQIVHCDLYLYADNLGAGRGGRVGAERGGRVGWSAVAEWVGAWGRGAVAEWVGAWGRGAVAEWVGALAWTGDRTVLAGFQSHCGKLRFGTLAIPFYPALPVSFGGDFKSRRSLLSGIYAR